MYAAHYNLREPPFSIAPDPAFLYMSARHQEALGHLLYGTGQYGGFVQLTGEVGTGKTTIVRTLLAQKLANVDIAMIHNPRQNEIEFVASICDELDVDYPGRGTAAGQPSIKVLVDALNQHLLASHAAGRRTVLIIDPPRKGTDERFIEQMIAFGASTVVYVSCNVHTQARDVGQMLQRREAKTKEEGGKKYVLESLRGLDLFPQTAHVEAIAVMRLV